MGFLSLSWHSLYLDNGFLVQGQSIWHTEEDKEEVSWRKGGLQPPAGAERAFGSQVGAPLRQQLTYDVSSFFMKELFTI